MFEQNAFHRRHNTTQVVDLDPKCVRLAPNGTNMGLFQIRFQYILAHKMGQIDSKWDKSGTFSDQISVHFGATAPKCTEI